MTLRVSNYSCKIQCTSLAALNKPSVIEIGFDEMGWWVNMKLQLRNLLLKTFMTMAMYGNNVM